MFKQRCFRLLLLASAIATSLSAAAYDFEWAGIYYNITGDNTVEVTRSDNYNNTYSGSVSIPETFTANGEYFVTKIGENAFAGSAVTSVSMPEGITSIGQYAFSGCQNLESVTLPESLTTLGSEAFSGCQNLESVALPGSLTTLGDRTFEACELLKTIKIPSGVTAIPDQCFYGCSSLESVTIPEGVTAIGYDAFSSCKFNALTLPSTITSIGGGAFINNDNLQSIICSATTPPTLGDYAFSHNSGIDIKVPLSSIAAYRQAEGWKNFTNYYGEEVAADGITYRINEKEAVVAAADSSLTEANILSSVEFEGNQYPVIKINSSVFSDNMNLTAVTLPEGLVEIGAYAFRECQNLASVTLPESLTTLDHSAFSSCKSLRAVKIPSGVTAIPDQCFYGCSSLESVTIPEGVTTIGDRAFYENRLKNLTLPSTITSIGERAFYCYSGNLQSIICSATIPPTLGDNAFSNGITPSIKVPISSIAVYKQANGWKDFTNYYGGDVVNNGITYRIDENGATITAAEATLAEANIPSAVEFEGNQYPVIKINDNVFAGNTNLTAVTLPAGLVGIGVSAFKECKNLESVTLPESLTTLGSGAFSGCKSLRAVKIPSKVTTIPYNCFNGCSSLESVTIPKGVTTIKHEAFQSCNLNVLALPESLETIESSAFNGNRSLKSVNIPAKVKTIGAWAFYGCGLKDLVIQEGVQTIDGNAFYGNPLQNLTLPSTITSIGNEAFRGNLQSIICNAATPPMLGDNAFSSGIMPSIKVPLASIAAYKKAYGWKNFSNYYGGEEIIDGVAYRIDDKGAYVQAAIMTESEVSLAENVAFEGAQYPLYKIADKAFAGNGSITLVTVPATVETIGSNAFDGVTYPIIKIKATTPPVLASKLPMFSAIVPPASVKAYKAANYWKEMTIIGEGKNDIEVTTSATVDLTEAIMTQAKITPASVTSIKVHGPLTNDDIINALNTNMRSCYAIDLSDAEIEALPDGAFNGKIGLLEITLPAGLKAIGNNAFNGCFALRNEVTIPAGVQTIGSYAFSGCRNAKFNPALPETLTTLGEGAFQQCEALVTADLMNPMDITSIPRYAFDGCSGLRNVYLPFFIEAVGDYAFRGCASLRQIQFVAPTKTIGAYAFSGCRSLKSLDLFKCENFTTIGSYAFSGCTSLKSLNLPKSLETIGEYAFSGCQAISVISSPSLVPPTIASESALNGIDKDVCVLTMPKSVYLDYFRAPYWGQFVEYTASVLVGVDGQGSVMYSNNLGTAPTPAKVAAFYATAGEGEGVEEDEGDGITAEAYDSANICAKDNSTLIWA